MRKIFVDPGSNTADGAHPAPACAPLPLVAPSWVIPGSASDNADFLRGKVTGIMLCCFEHAPRLPAELPQEPCDLQWHVHLPTDLPWEQGGGVCAQAACAIMDTAAHLLNAHSRAILHPPPGPALLADFVRVWQRAGYALHSLLLENVPEARTGLPGFVAACPDLRLCLDAAHLVLSAPAARAEWLAAGALHRVDMVHWSAPAAGRDAHAPLTELDADAKKLYRHIAECTSAAVDTLELFDWSGIPASWDILRAWRDATHGGNPRTEAI